MPTYRNKTRSLIGQEIVVALLLAIHSLLLHHTFEPSILQPRAIPPTRENLRTRDDLHTTTPLEIHIEQEIRIGREKDRGTAGRGRESTGISTNEEIRENESGTETGNVVMTVTLILAERIDLLLVDIDLLLTLLSHHRDRIIKGLVYQLLWFYLTTPTIHHLQSKHHQRVGHIHQLMFYH